MERLKKLQPTLDKEARALKEGAIVANQSSSYYTAHYVSTQKQNVHAPTI